MTSEATNAETIARRVVRNVRNKMRQGNVFTRHRLSETVNNDPNVENLQREPYMDIPRCSAANGENPSVTGFDRYIRKQMGVSFASVLTHIRHNCSPTALSLDCRSLKARRGRLFSGLRII